jgi:hypothetical protein
MSQKPAAPGSAPAPAPATPAPAKLSITALKVPDRARRSAGLTVRVTLSGAAPVTVTVCGLKHGRCTGRSAHRTVQSKGVATRIVVPVRKLKRGRYSVLVSAPGVAPIVKPVRLA